MSNQIPCLPNCPRRNATCHVDCKDYLVYKHKNDAERDRRFEQREKNDILFNPKAVSRQWQR